MNPSAFANVQRIVLCGGSWRVAGPRRIPWSAASHLLLRFGSGSALHAVNRLLREMGPTSAATQSGETQISLGFTRRGLERTHVPDHVLSKLALMAPAFWAGADLRAAGHAALTGRNGCEHWQWPLDCDALDAVLSLHGGTEAVADAGARVLRCAKAAGLEARCLPLAEALPPPPDVGPEARADPSAQWVHFGYRDGLSPVGIRGWTVDATFEKLKAFSKHEPGEFVLGHRCNSGGTSWIAGPGLRVWSDEVREFFRDGSFGVLQQMEQDVEAFEAFVDRATWNDPRLRAEIKGKLCGRYPDGRPLVAAQNASMHDDFDYTGDSEGVSCPFGSHARRMNPRLAPTPEGIAELPEARRQRTAHFGRLRPLLRRGMPYGPSWTGSGRDSPDAVRGLMGHFFCASIEDQFEHLLAEWADRVPMGSPDIGGARDPFVGDHQTGDGPFVIPAAAGHPKRLRDLTAFTRTVGMAYLFYPSLTTLKGIADSSLWAPDDWDDDA